MSSGLSSRPLIMMKTLKWFERESGTENESLLQSAGKLMAMIESRMQSKIS